MGTQVHSSWSCLLSYSVYLMNIHVKLYTCSFLHLKYSTEEGRSSRLLALLIYIVILIKKILLALQCFLKFLFTIINIIPYSQVSED